MWWPLPQVYSAAGRVRRVLVAGAVGKPGFVRAGIIHYEDLRLCQYKGNLSEFVKQKPEARSYYELSNANLKFKFPEPGFLEGVKSKDRAILKMSKAGIRCVSPSCSAAPLSPWKKPRDVTLHLTHLSKEAGRSRALNERVQNSAVEWEA